MMSDEAGYRSFLLRMWLIKTNGGRICRASLENPRTEQKENFSSLEELIEYLRDLSKVLESEAEGVESQ